MKTKTDLITVLTLALTLLASQAADLVVYDLSQTARLIGDEVDFRSSRSGSVAVDPTTGDAQAIITFSQNGHKYFQIDSYNFTISHSIANRKTFTSWSQYYANPANQVSLFVMAYGQDSVLPVTMPKVIVPARTLTGPKTLTGRAQEFAGATANAVIWDSTVTLTFNSKSTQSANLMPSTPEAYVAGLRTLYLSKGYTEVQSSM